MAMQLVVDNGATRKHLGVQRLLRGILALMCLNDNISAI
jgi:hypothetical protein